MNRNAVIYPFGNSDIRINNKNVDKQNFRSKTKEILNLSYKSGCNIFTRPSSENKLFGIKIEDGSMVYEVSFPILSALIHYLDTSPLQIKHSKVDYYFLYTDQPDESMNTQDTLFLFKLAKRLLTEIGVEEEEINSIRIDYNPTDFSKVFEHFGKFVEEKEERLKDYENIFVILGPGTPQMMSGLLLNFTDFKNAHFLSIPRNKKPYRITFPNKIRSKGIKESVAELIERFDYIAALNLYKTLPEDEQKNIKILEALSHRINFDFDEAYKAFNDYYQRYTYDFLNELKPTFEQLKYRNNVELLKELYYKFAISIESGYYLEAVAMIFRFEEEILKVATEKVLNVKINSEDKFKKFKDTVEKNKELVEELDSHGIRWKDSAPNRVTYKGIIDHFYKKDKSRWLEHIKDASDALEEKLKGQNKSLVDLRNKTPFAHEFEGASKKKIKAIYGDPEALRRKFRELLKAVDIDAPDINESDFPFRKINNWLVKKIKEV